MIPHRHATPGAALRQQKSRYHPKTYNATVMIGIPAMRVPLNRTFGTAVKADDYARRFSERWNRFEDRRLFDETQQSPESGNPGAEKTDPGDGFPG